LLAVTTAASVSACASSSSSTSALAGLSPDQIVQKSVADLKTASSVRITGNVVSSGQHIAVNLTDVAAKGCQAPLAWQPRPRRAARRYPARPTSSRPAAPST
jgi:hypothetical protein